ncbi:DUF3810 domain-containing protein [Parabacteroides sp. OttesenSCG-928-K15]|nr:DUF3810 domain-containing protein [Parabacteroides sp. OttesenSCG-928-K15]
MDRRLYIRWILLSLLLLFIWAAMLWVDIGEWYARSVYPLLSSCLSRLSSVFFFSVGDCFIIGSIIGLLAYLIYAIIKRRGFWKRLRCILECLVWIYAWFYLAWGLNYFRHNFYTRAQIPPARYEADHFHTFLTAYTDSLHASWCVVEETDPSLVAVEINGQYRKLPPHLGILRPSNHLRAKPMLSSSFMSSVGVKGYMGPFFTEFNLNRQLLPVEYAFTYAHELAHALSISNEAEANLYAYQVCTASRIPEIRFSGYFGLFPYVLRNAQRLLPSDDYKAWLDSLHPDIKALYNQRIEHWQALYNPTIGEMQDKVYNLFLKSNRISSGTANYSEVIALLMALDKNKKSN